MNDAPQMIRDTLLILRSVDFFEEQIAKKSGELQEARNNDYFEDEIRIEKEMEVLLKKINEEHQELDRFMKKYNIKIEDPKTNEKKTVLPNPKQEK